ncbi:MAG: TraR/DksA C4-type zinc finger protein [Candidatus Brocadiae bacterium]|nr:TraR/DksA C4-type zinc finger protein [Candidatus Brocadiia bacterium]
MKKDAKKDAKKDVAKPEKKEAPKVQVKSPFTKPELEVFRRWLLARREAVSGNVTKMEDEALRGTRGATGDLSSMPIHMADIGSDTFEQDFTLGLIENEELELGDIEDALERIADGSFGVCEECSKLIPRERLKALPHAALCVPCKKKEEDEAAG